MVEAIAAHDPERAHGAHFNHVMRARERLTHTEAPPTASTTEGFPMRHETPGHRAEAISFIENVTYNDLPAEALRIGKRCMVDTLGLYLAAVSNIPCRCWRATPSETGGREDAVRHRGRPQEGARRARRARARHRRPRA